ncbi:MAG: phytanoyl-CoA dioxygenase family protein [Phycisphaerales bacterium]
MNKEFITEFGRDGYFCWERLLSDESVAMLRALAEPLLARHADGRGGVRGPLGIEPRLCAALDFEPVAQVVGAVGSGRAKLVRSILFDKTPDANWLVPWHQDVAIAVRERREADGFGPWSVKDGLVHCQPPVEVLESMFTLRLHLDPCGPENGPLRVIPGSHRHGITDADITEAQRTNAVECTTPAGGAVLMRPLTLHASPKASSPAHRRVLHLEFATCDLPGGLERAGV